ncbi:hypothetical protein FKM82_031178 [Ascaphus truei]
MNDFTDFAQDVYVTMYKSSHARQEAACGVDYFSKQKAQRRLLQAGGGRTGTSPGGGRKRPPFYSRFSTRKRSVQKN